MRTINGINNKLNTIITHLAQNNTYNIASVNISIQITTKKPINITKTLLLPHKTTTAQIYHLSQNIKPLTNIINITSTTAINNNKYKIITTNANTYQQLKKNTNRKIKKLIKKIRIVKSITEITYHQQGRIKKITINKLKPINIKVGDLKINTPIQIIENIKSVITTITKELKILNIKPKIKLFINIHGKHSSELQ
ncbi:hypothetical protein JSR02_00020 [Candidatus Vidania fulgoroideae]|uniref:Uncharacterized protein n=1 Tax=Candidatus Vidania fulgoroideorum TaxID=881286 RepID=A0A974X763_9PROT|nr:hypothetical protein JSR02_00020 [Candidatus Vidania fulgoroideae]